MAFAPSSGVNDNMRQYPAKFRRRSVSPPGRQIDLLFCGLRSAMVSARSAYPAAFAGGLDLLEKAQALDAIREVGPGAHFLASAHTRANFEAAFFRPKNADAKSYEQWLADGAKDSAQRANERWKRLLRDYEQPVLDPAVDEALEDYLVRRKSEMPDLSYA